MAEYNIYGDIAERSGGDVYIGVVGPVRTGKSTFIKKFMDLLVIPNIRNSYQAERAKDELPQSAGGRTIMTTEPKFIPNEAVEISLGDNARLKVRMIDCVGYIVDSALGYIEDEAPRMVSTPWNDSPIPFFEAAEIGTKKVICEHSNIGLVITTDGSITEIPREDYVTAEKRVINELREINKPFIVLLNNVSPGSDETMQLKESMEAEYEVPVVPVNCAQLEAADIHRIIEAVLFEFPLREISIKVPSWLSTLDNGHWLKKSINEGILEKMNDISKVRHTRALAKSIEEFEFIESSSIEGMDLGVGEVVMRAEITPGMFYKILGEETGFSVNDEMSLMRLMRELAATKSEYDKIAAALKDVRETGYGIVSPCTDELTLDEPKIVKQGGRFGVKLKASAPSIHMMCSKQRFLNAA
ncbi:MAG: stage IV sporulation protein A [Clostridia bacterium]|nr:stage IV sporulation protein A [Clostridia bacterium]